MSLLGCLVITEGYIVAYLATNLQNESYTIRELLNAAFSDLEISDLAFDRFKAVHDQFSSEMGKNVKISRLIEYCKRYCTLDDLISEAKARNISQFRNYETRLYS